MREFGALLRWRGRGEPGDVVDNVLSRAVRYRLAIKFGGVPGVKAASDPIL